MLFFKMISMCPRSIGGTSFSTGSSSGNQSPPCIVARLISNISVPEAAKPNVSYTVNGNNVAMFFNPDLNSLISILSPHQKNDNVIAKLEVSDFENGIEVVHDFQNRTQSITKPIPPKYYSLFMSLNATGLIPSLEACFGDQVKKGISMGLENELLSSIAHDNQTLTNYHITLRGNVQDVSLKDALDKIINYLTSQKIKIQTVSQSSEANSASRTGKSIFNCIYEFDRVDFILKTSHSVMDALKKVLFHDSRGLAILVANEKMFDPKRTDGRELMVLGDFNDIPWDQKIGGIFFPYFKQVTVAAITEENISFNYLYNSYENSKEIQEFKAQINQINEAEELIQILSEKAMPRNTINILLERNKKNPNDNVTQKALKLIYCYLYDDQSPRNLAHFRVFNRVITDPLIRSKYKEEFGQKLISSIMASSPELAIPQT